MRFTRRAAAFAVALALFSSHASLCAAWMAEREVPVDCPMHEQGSGHDAMPSAPDGDDPTAPCCAMSGREGATPSEAAFALTPSLGNLDTTAPPVARRSVTRHARRAFVPAPGSHVARHLLLTVLLV